MENLLTIVFINICCVGAGKSTLMPLSDVFCPYLFFREMEKTQPMGEEMDGKLFIFRQNQQFFS